LDDQVDHDVAAARRPSRGHVDHSATAKWISGTRPLKPLERALWSHRVAVQFDSPLTDFELEIEALATRQRKLGRRP
jgi:hypothetical protein